MPGPSASAARAAGIAVGVVLDAVLGDPAHGHPVAAFGRMATALESRLYRPTRTRGVAFLLAALVPPIAAGLVTEAGLATGRVPAVQGRPSAGWLVLARAALTAAATWVALGGTSLAREGMAMASSLEVGDIEAARRRLSHLCARDGSTLDAEELARATVESLAENTSDAVVAPLIWAAVAGVPGALGYRAANTLDAMVGYRSQRYQRFGWAAARLDDLLNLLPARLTGALTALCAPVVGASASHTWKSTLRDAGHHPSPNAGWCEAAVAAALGVRLGGANVYNGEAEVRPYLGVGGRPVEVADIRRAIRLGRSVGLTAAVFSVALPGLLLLVVRPVVRTVARPVARPARAPRRGADWPPAVQAAEAGTGRLVVGR